MAAQAAVPTATGASGAPGQAKEGAEAAPQAAAKAGGAGAAALTAGAGTGAAAARPKAAGMAFEEVRAELKATSALVAQLQSEMVQSKAEVARLTRALVNNRRQTLTLEAHVAALQAPWLGHAGEVRCATGHRCADYINAGEDKLAATSSVASCKAYCNATFPEVPFFAFHSEQGMTQFMNDPKGRCRCYDATPCNLIPDSGYTLWSTATKCSSIVRDVPE